MLERYFVRPRTYDRIRSLWLGPAIDRYVNWLDERQAATATIKRHVQVLVEFNDFACAEGANAWVDLPAHLEPFVAHWIQKHGARCRTRHDRLLVQSHARAPVEQLLRLLLPGFVGRPRHSPLPFQSTVPEFFNHLREERGLRAATVHGYEHHLRAFEDYLQRINASDLAELSPALLSTFLIESAQRLKSGGIQGRSGKLRVFLRYLYRQDVIDTDLARAVPRGRGYRQSALPRAISWADVQRMLEMIDRRAPVGKRDYALLLLLVTYGLRAREVAALQLEDLDWQQAQLHVSARKGGHSTIYPLSTTVGEAIIDYLRCNRPNADDRHVFLTVKAPFVPLNQFVVSARAGIYLRAAGIHVRRAGSHTLRHTCVQRLVEADVPFKVIGDYVGHRSQASTQIYGKVALHRLRQLALGAAEEAL